MPRPLEAQHSGVPVSGWITDGRCRGAVRRRLRHPGRVPDPETLTERADGRVAVGVSSPTGHQTNNCHGHRLEFMPAPQPESKRSHSESGWPCSSVKMAILLQSVGLLHPVSSSTATPTATAAPIPHSRTTRSGQRHQGRAPHRRTVHRPRPTPRPPTHPSAGRGRARPSTGRRSLGTVPYAGDQSG
jgi:hypothetical protein